jgi:hypothetical protein
MRSSKQTKPEIASESAETEKPNDEIAALAYQLWTDRGCPVGSPDEDWFRAEEELKSCDGAATAAA